MQIDLCKIHKEVQKRQGNDHLTSPLHPLRFLVPYLEIDEWVLNFIPYVKIMYEKIRKIPSHGKNEISGKLTPKSNKY